MKRTALMMLAAVALLPIAASAATFVVPAAGTGAGAGGSQWQTELTLHSNSIAPVTAALTFHDRNGAGETATVVLAPRSTVAIGDIVKTRFGRDGGTGAIEIVVGDAVATKLAITSRTFNKSEAGEFGQDIPAVNLKNAATAGQTIVLAAPSSVAGYRFNAGIYAAADSSIRWDLVRADGTLVKSVTADYAAGTQAQYNLAVETFFGETPADNDTLLAFVNSGTVIVYGSAVNNGTGDPSFVPGIATTVDVHIQLLGIDADLDGNVEIGDANQDGVLDTPMNIFMATPNSFRLLVAGNNPKFELVDGNAEVFVTTDGYIVWMPSTDAAQSLKIKVTVGDTTDIFTIPVHFM